MIRRSSIWERRVTAARTARTHAIEATCSSVLIPPSHLSVLLITPDTCQTSLPNIVKVGVLLCLIMIGTTMIARQAMQLFKARFLS